MIRIEYLRTVSCVFIVEASKSSKLTVVLLTCRTLRHPKRHAHKVQEVKQQYRCQQLRELLSGAVKRVLYPSQSNIFEMQSMKVDAHLEDILGQLNTKVGVPYRLGPFPHLKHPREKNVQGTSNLVQYRSFSFIFCNFQFFRVVYFYLT